MSFRTKPFSHDDEVVSHLANFFAYLNEFMGGEEYDPNEPLDVGKGKSILVPAHVFIHRLEELQRKKGKINDSVVHDHVAECYIRFLKHVNRGRTDIVDKATDTANKDLGKFALANNRKHFTSRVDIQVMFPSLQEKFQNAMRNAADPFLVPKPGEKWVRVYPCESCPLQVRKDWEIIPSFKDGTVTVPDLLVRVIQKKKTSAPAVFRLQAVRSVVHPAIAFLLNSLCISNKDVLKERFQEFFDGPSYLFEAAIMGKAAFNTYLADTDNATSIVTNRGSGAENSGENPVARQPIRECIPKLQVDMQKETVEDVRQAMAKLDKLLTDPYEWKMNQKDAIEFDAPAVLIFAMKKWWMDAAVQESGCRCLADLTSNVEIEAASCIAVQDGAVVMLKAMTAFPDNKIINVCASSVLCNLIPHEPTRHFTVGRLVEANGLEQLVKVMSAFHDDPSIQKFCCGLLTDLCKEEDNVIDALKKAGAVVAVGRVSEHHWEDEEVEKAANDFWKAFYSRK